MSIVVKKDDLVFVPIGGTCEVGMNIALYHYGGKWIIVDCGAGFADEEFPGIDILVVDSAFIDENRDDIVGIIITHIHEDHSGGLAYIWDKVRCPVYTTKFVKNFLRKKINPAIFNCIEINEIDYDGVLKLGFFDIEFISMTHSTPEMKAVAMHTPKGTLLHSGDWKFDDDPVVGSVTDKEKIARISREKGVLAFIGDSTNIFSNGRSGSEGELYEPLLEIVKKAQGQLVAVTLFASNVARINTLWNIAKATNRKVLVLGRSIVDIIEVAKESGYLSDLNYYTREDLEEVDSFRSELLVFCTGCQGDKLGASYRVSSNDYPGFNIRSGETFIFSSKIIPGNEKGIYRMVNNLLKSGVNVVNERDAKVHVSGHPYRDEIKEMYELVKPEIAIPVHGEYMHLSAHVQLAKECGVKKTFLVSNGAVCVIDKTGVTKIAKVETGTLGVEGRFLYPKDGTVLSMRRRIANAGAIIVVLIFNDEGRLIVRPKILFLGCIGDIKVNDNMVDSLRKKFTKEAKFVSRLEVIKATRKVIRKFCLPSKLPSIEVHVERIRSIPS